MRRERLKERVTGGGNYFAEPKDDIAFISSGCKTLDLALGGGWAENRIANIIGDSSTGKTLLAIEAATNFSIKYPKKGVVRYREAEAAFDKQYAAALGMPMNCVDFGSPLETIEDLFEDLEAVIKKARGPELYVLDSLDSLSDRGEVGRTMDEASYGAEKAKKLSQLFRRLTSQMASANVTLLIVSQVRSKIGISFGRKTTRSGGRALNFYSSQIIYLANVGTLSRTINSVKRPTGISVRAKVDKNKIALPFREATFDVTFGYGIDDMLACLNWLKEVKHLDDVGLGKMSDEELRKHTRELMRGANGAYSEELTRIHEAVEKRWWSIEKSFLPAKKKYESVQ